MKVAKRVTQSVVDNANAVKSGIFTNAGLVKSGLLEMVSCHNALACFIALLVLAYIAMVTPATALDFFTTVPGKLIAMLVLLMAIAVDMRLGVLVAVAIVISITFASFNTAVESFSSLDESEEAISSEDDALDLPESSEDVEDSEDATEDVGGLDVPVAGAEFEDIAGPAEEMVDSENFTDYAPANF